MKMKTMNIVLSLMFFSSIYCLCSCNNSATSQSDNHENEQYVIYYYDNYTDNYPLTLQVSKNEYAQNITELERENYVFSGWYTTPDCLDNELFDFTNPITSDINLYAKWDKTVFDYYNITFANSGLEPYLIKEGESFTLPDINKDGYRFDGYLNGNNIYNIGDSITPTSNMTFEAKFSKYVTLTYDLAGGEGLSELKQTYIEGDTVYITDSIVTREDFEFGGWFYENVEYEDSFIITKDITLTADWIGYFSVSFIDEMGSGTLPENQDLLSGTTYTIPSYNGNLEDYSFLGFKDQNGDLYTEGETYQITDSNVVFTAYYKINTYIVSFVDWDNTVLYNTVVNAKEGIEKYPSHLVTTVEEFTGWDKSLDELSSITSKTIVKAQYSFSSLLLEPSNYTFEETSNGYLIGKKGTTYSGSLALPSSYKGKLVVGTIVDSVYSKCGFQGCKSITSLYIPSTFTSINTNAFYSCSAIINVTGMKNVVSFAEQAFYGCSSLTNITFPKNVTTIPNGCFTGCSSLSNLVIPEGIKTIEDSAFQNCTFSEVSLPSTLSSITSYSFRYCKSLSTINFAGNSNFAVENNIIYQIDSNKNKIRIIFSPIANLAVADYEIPNTVKTIDNNAFYQSTTLNSITYQENSSLERVGDYAFSNCKNLTSISLPGSITYIGSYCFSYIKANVTFAEGLKVLGDYAFISYEGSEISLPASLEKIGDFAFYSSLVEKVTFSGNSSLNSIGRFAFYNCSGLESFNSDSLNTFIIPNTVGFIGEFAFYGNILMKYLTLSNSLKEIGAKAFSCDFYSSVHSLDDLTTYVNELDSKSYKLMQIETLYIPASVQTIGYMAFAYNVKLKSVIFEDNSKLTDFGADYEDAYSTYRGYVFDSCISLTDVDMGDNNSVMAYKMGVFARCVELVNFSYGENCKVELLDSCVFMQCVKLENVIIPDKVFYLGAQVFLGTAITSMHIPGSVEILEAQTFRKCSNLKTVTYDPNVKIQYMSYWLFNNCSSLESITLPASVSTFGSWLNGLYMSYVFEGCSSLNNIYVDENNPYIVSVGY